MRRISRWCLALGLSAAALLVAPAPARACSCMQSTEAENVARADAVFQGTVTKRFDPTETDPIQNSADPVTWTVDVDKIEKGTVADPQDVRSPKNSASCGYDFAVGQRYRVFAQRQDDGHFNTNLCAGNAALSAAPPTTAPIATTTTTGAPPTTATTVGGSSTTAAGATTTPTTALAIRPTSRGNGGGGRGAVALLAGLGVIVAGAGVVLIRRLR